MTILAWKDTLKKVKEILEKAPIGYWKCGSVLFVYPLCCL